MNEYSSNTPVRYYDSGRLLLEFAGQILVVCPRCGGRAVNLRRPDLPPPRYPGQFLHQPRRLVCAECEVVVDWPSRAERSTCSCTGGLGERVDPNFRQPLWLQTRCAGHILWALNVEHVDELAGYVGARLRERSGSRSTSTLFARLPLWMKVADNRAQVLAGLDRLRLLAESSAPGDRSDAAY